MSSLFAVCPAPFQKPKKPKGKTDARVCVRESLGAREPVAIQLAVRCTNVF